MTKDERIEAELARMNEIYSDLPEDTLTILTPLIQNAAFMAVTLQDLQEEINQNGAVETYQNGANQYGRKQSAAVQAYNAMINRYNDCIKVLSAKMPVVKEKTVFWKPTEIPEKTDAEREEERRQQEARDERLQREFEEVSRRQHEQWEAEKRPKKSHGDAENGQFKAV